MCLIQAKRAQMGECRAQAWTSIKTLFTRKEGGDAVKGVMHACTPG